MNHPCDRRTDRQTDGIAIAYARLAYMLSRAKNQNIRFVRNLILNTSWECNYNDVTVIYKYADKRWHQYVFGVRNLLMIEKMLLRSNNLDTAGIVLLHQAFVQKLVEC